MTYHTQFLSNLSHIKEMKKSSIYYGSHNTFYIPELNKKKPFHPGTILDWEGDYLLINFFSTTPMSKYYSGWKDQGIYPEGEGGKDMDSYGMPNQTSWIHKDHLYLHWGTFSESYMDMIYEENEKFYGKKFEEITFTKKIKTPKFWGPLPLKKG